MPSISNCNVLKQIGVLINRKVANAARVQSIKENISYGKYIENALRADLEKKGVNPEEW